MQDLLVVSDSVVLLPEVMRLIFWSERCSKQLMQRFCSKEGTMSQKAIE